MMAGLVAVGVLADEAGDVRLGAACGLLRRLEKGVKTGLEGVFSAKGFYEPG